MSSSDRSVSPVDDCGVSDNVAAHLRRQQAGEPSPGALRQRRRHRAHARRAGAGVQTPVPHGQGRICLVQGERAGQVHGIGSGHRVRHRQICGRPGQGGTELDDAQRRQIGVPQGEREAQRCVVEPSAPVGGDEAGSGSQGPSRDRATAVGPRHRRASLTVFADSSALVKLYADEPGAALVRSVGPVVVSSLARVEVPAALWRKHRAGELSAQDAGLLTAEFAADWHEPAGPFIPVVVQGQVLERAAALVTGRGLRAYDGAQLACATAARDADPQVDAFLCFDASLSDAAAREGFHLLA